MFFKKKEATKKQAPSMKKVPNNKCPKCGQNSIYRVEGVDDVSLWCIECGWRQIDYALNKPSIFS